MLFEYSNHCLEQMHVRNISKQIIDSVMNKPDSIIYEKNKQQIYQKVTGQYLYRVFVNANRIPTLIKTVYKTSKISKYKTL
ncbi:MAG: hypothetical protein COS42_00955 [Flavobacteriales bacterium CG03_land_8_20_14_0_80_35_15]|nr:MAG: hypothetical protein COS42_00955 [Flavobacteriales bacterium CG03_land_8_20_14_0_80_35_15]PJA05088.1 MAG: hypothetical protein COX71_08530 [Flavobacteriales bacterium CG_4_10_14_0_2_um_filter_35_18]